MLSVSRADTLAQEASWNKTIAATGIKFELKLPHRRFRRNIGNYSAIHTDTDGNVMSQEEWDKVKDSYIPSGEDEAYICSLMKPCMEPGKIANWIAPPRRGINGQPFEYEYVKLD